MIGRFRFLVIICLLLVAATAVEAQSANDYARAEVLVREGQFDQGVTLLTRIVAREPRNFQAYNLMGIALTGEGELATANTKYRRALQIKPGFVPALKNLAINELTINQTEVALKHFTAALKIAPHDPVIHAYLGKIAYSRQDYRGASDHLAKAGELVKDPSVVSQLIDSELQLGETEHAKQVLGQIETAKLTSRWQFHFGLVLAQHQLFQEAVPFFQSSISNNSDFYDAAFDLAICYVETKQYSRAIDALNRLVDHGYKTAELYNLLSESYEGDQQTQQAIDALREAVQLSPQDENSYVALTALCTKYEAYDLALEIIQTGLNYQPQSHRLTWQRGVVHLMQEKYDLAEQDFQLASQLSPQQNLSDIALGVNYMAKGDYEKAVEVLRQRTKEKPADATLHYFLGVDLLRLGAEPGTAALVEAQTEMEKSVELDPRVVAPRVELGKIYLRENRVAEAIRSLEAAHVLDPNDRSACAQLAVAYRRQGKPELAAPLLEALKRLNDEERQRPQHERRLRVVTENPPPGDPK